ncbi:MAG: FadR/GntR family transcriptional regulator [Desulfarculaceae bacterium]|jgi:GntR family transcriptional repressor for pyruvate dehydrogenase complex
MAKFQNVVQEPAFVKIINQIKDQISSGDLLPGDRLPPERQLAEMMGVNRHTVREALKTLEYMGVVECKTGMGTIINNLGQDLLIDQISQAAGFSPQQLLSDIMELRLLLEPGIAALAAERATDSELAAMQEAMNDLEKEFSNSCLGTDADERLHIALAKATHNATIYRLAGPMLKMLAQYREKSLKIKSRRSETLKEHNKIFQAVKNRQPQAASEAMTQHLNKVKGVF